MDMDHRRPRRPSWSALAYDPIRCPRSAACPAEATVRRLLGRTRDTGHGRGEIRRIKTVYAVTSLTAEQAVNRLRTRRPPPAPTTRAHPLGRQRYLAADQRR
ncbi:MAG: hypothetical protein ACRDTC_26645 [Pseudonocardiaceae bacterium]